MIRVAIFVQRWNIIYIKIALKIFSEDKQFEANMPRKLELFTFRERTFPVKITRLGDLKSKLRRKGVPESILNVQT